MARKAAEGRRRKGWGHWPSALSGPWSADPMAVSRRLRVSARNLSADFGKRPVQMIPASSPVVGHRAGMECFENATRNREMPPRELRATATENHGLQIQQEVDEFLRVPRCIPDLRCGCIAVFRAGGNAVGHDIPKQNIMPRQPRLVECFPDIAGRWIGIIARNKISANRSRAWRFEQEQRFG